MERKIIGMLKTAKPEEFVEIEVYYSKGGANYFNGTSDPRGYWLAIRPVTVKDGCKSYQLMQGFKKFLVASKRKSNGSMLLAVARALEYKDEILDAVLKKEGITLAEEVAA